MGPLALEAYGTTMEQLWNNYGTTMEQLWNNLVNNWFFVVVPRPHVLSRGGKPLGSSWKPPWGAKGLEKTVVH
jgi:hypothetical protein